MKEQIISLFNAERRRSFYSGRVYPAIIAALVAVGSITGTEFFFNLIHTALLIDALLVSTTVRPLIISLCTYVYQVSVVHSPFHPSFSDYYVSGWRFPILVAVAIALIGAFAYFIIKNKIFRELSFKKTPLLFPSLLLALAFLLNGAFSSSYKPSDLIFGAAQAFVYVFVFILLYHGLEADKASASELASYFAYLSLLIALVLSAEMVALFATADNVFANGGIIKENVVLGWGIFNLIGVSCAVLIPMNFYGMTRSRHPWLYFAVATLVYLVSILTMSRNALIFSTLTYVACIIIFCFVGERKRAFRIIAAAGLAALIAIAAIFGGKLYSLFADYFERGFSDNGRFELWGSALSSFSSAPIFGSGFYGLNADYYIYGPLPHMAHNTVLELLSATGLVGLLAYGYYRWRSLAPFIKKPSLMKSLLGISVLTLLLESLLDNFVFNVYPMFYAFTALAIAFKSSREEAACGGAEALPLEGE